MRFSFLGAARRSRLRRRAIVAASALALGFGLAAVASTQASAATGCSVAYATSSEWPGGFAANVTITNTVTSSINGWTLTFTYPGDQRVTNAWNTALTQSGKNITATNLSYNATIAPGGNTVIGWQGIWTTSDAPPTSFSINGTACNGGGGGLSPTVSLTSPTKRPDVHRARQHDAERERRLHQHRIGHVHGQRLRLHLGQRHRYGDDERRRWRSRRRPVHGREYLQEPRLRQRGEGAGGGRWQQPGRGGGRQPPDRYLDGPHRGDHRRQHPHGPAGSAGQRGNSGPGHHATGV